jgi:hypothetical protein
MDTDFELNESLLVTDMNTLEEGEECYIKFYNNTEFHYNGLYNIVKLFNFNYVNFMVKVKNTHTDFDLVYTRHNNKDICGVFVVYTIEDTCDIYKLPTETEYILK